MPTLDGAASAQKELASDAGVTAAVAATKSGADLEYLRLQREASGATQKSGADATQLAATIAHIIAVGKPTSYLAAGGEATRIIGKGFTSATAVQFGGTNGTAFSVVNDEVINVTTPAKGAGTYTLTIVHPNGNANLANGVTFV